MEKDVRSTEYERWKEIESGEVVVNPHPRTYLSCIYVCECECMAVTVVIFIGSCYCLGDEQSLICND